MNKWQECIILTVCFFSIKLNQQSHLDWSNCALILGVVWW